MKVLDIKKKRINGDPTLYFTISGITDMKDFCLIISMLMEAGVAVDRIEIRDQAEIGEHLLNTSFRNLDEMKKRIDHIDNLPNPINYCSVWGHSEDLRIYFGIYPLKEHNNVSLSCTEGEWLLEKLSERLLGIIEKPGVQESDE